MIPKHMMTLKKRFGRVRHRLENLFARARSRAAGRRVIFLHIPKCAGSSVNLLFKSRYGSGRSGQVVLINDLERGPAHKASLARARDALFVGGHFGFETLEKIRGDAFVFTILRDPIDRLRSIHGHLSSRRRFNPLGDKALGMPFADFITSKDPEILQWTDNVIARMLAARHDRQSCCGRERDDVVQQAISNLSHLDHVGFLRTFDEDLQVAAKAAGVRFTPVRANVGGVVLKDAISPETFRQLARSCIADDVMVYDKACASFGAQDG